MGNTLSAREIALMGVAGLSAAIALKYRSESRANQSRKNELALSLLQVRKMNQDREASSQYGQIFKPRPSDVFIVTFPKCGTTWMTQICHMLRGGDMNFGEITEVCPWDEMAMICGQGSYLLCREIYVNDLKFQKISKLKSVKTHETIENHAGPRRRPSKEPSTHQESFGARQSCQWRKVHLRGPQSRGRIRLLLPLSARISRPQARRPHRHATLFRSHLGLASKFHLGSLPGVVRGQRRPQCALGLFRGHEERLQGPDREAKILA